MISTVEISDFLHLDEYAGNLYSCSDSFPDKRLEYYNWQAQKVYADYFYCINSELENIKVPFVYVYDERGKTSNGLKDIKAINKQIWTIGEIPFAIVVYDFEIKIIDTRQHINEKTGEANLLESIPIQDVELKLKRRILDGLVLEESHSDYVKVSPYQTLLRHIEDNILKKASIIGCDEILLKQLLVKFILIKYLEEQIDENGNSVFQDGYFNQFIADKESESYSFCDVLRNGNIFKLLVALNDKFNGGIFHVAPTADTNIENYNFSPVADALDGSVEIGGQLSIWKLYDFNLLPIEFISRLYERFVTSSENEKQQGTGAFYTPPHLARLLIDELLPFNISIDFDNFRILDPSCGSGIFLVLAYKRLITLWMLANNKQKIQGRNDIDAIKNLLSNSIYGVDISEDALSITATSLQIELTSHIQPKEIWESLVYDNLVCRGNLFNEGFYKWHRSHQNKYNIIVGNPPFKISDKENDQNILLGKDLDFKAEVYENTKGRKTSFPQNNPALSILYRLLTNSLTQDGILFLILPATATIYNSNLSTRDYLETILTHWEVSKIYDFSPLRASLWNRAAVATVAVLIKQKKLLRSELIQHLIIRNTDINKQGSIRFQIDKYDSFYLSIDDALKKPYIWKSNLLGGGHIRFVIDKYKNPKLFLQVSDLPSIKNKEWIMQDGAKSSLKEGKDIAEKGLPLLLSKEVKSDEVGDEVFDTAPQGLYRFDNENVYIAPNLIIKCNINQGLPIIYNTQRNFIFDNTFLGIKALNIDDQELLALSNVLKENRKLYKFLITVTSSKTFLQKGGNSIINSNDLKRLPITIDENGAISELEQLTPFETAIIDDTELMAKSLDKTNGPLFKKVTISDVKKFCDAFSENLNFVYQEGDYKFRPLRQVIQDDFIWVSFKHTNEKINIESKLISDNKSWYQRIFKDDDTNKGLSINRVITYYGEENVISFLKPNRLKYWTRSIGYRDAENVKADMFVKGY